MQGLNPDAAPSQWLLVLLVIEKGVRALFEKEINEDIVDLAFILVQQQPQVRQLLLQQWIAQLPKCDWKQFKLLGLRLAKAFADKQYSAAAVSAYPWLPAAAQQLGRELEQQLPDWLIEGMLSDYDRHQMLLQHAKRPFLFGPVEAPQPPEGSAEERSSKVAEELKQQIEEAAVSQKAKC
ncbi:hypothetical protein ETH_00001135 [Eimeria tenella]|uniref:Uncharacterized protein n=1 Tax=Eimeria tenella TaxID=5802 RepID=U6KJ27_EIMTE|nr:hypothetical protein ETH_00001135 [Eimeria tenella]CDJ37914.1 hypothetical protein ETH_00001135 [Eimeria tenella]|eukprot:XP_013228752.1 hypothetical protein ETH_00001135 [Eimeria tenella]